MPLEHTNRVTLAELNRLSMECECGADFAIDTEGDHPVPKECPFCSRPYAEWATIAQLRRAFRVLLQEEDAWPKISFRVAAR